MRGELVQPHHLRCRALVSDFGWKITTQRRKIAVSSVGRQPRQPMFGEFGLKKISLRLARVRGYYTRIAHPPRKDPPILGGLSARLAASHRLRRFARARDQHHQPIAVVRHAHRQRAAIESQGVRGRAVDETS